MLIFNILDLFHNFSLQIYYKNVRFCSKFAPKILQPTTLYEI